MKLYVLGDLHISDKEYHTHGVLEMMSWMRENFEEGNAVLFLGDILTSMSANILAVQQLITLTKLLDDMHMEKHILMGNHDYGMLNRQARSADDFYESLGYSVYRDITEAEVCGIKCLMIPWKRTSEKEVTKELEAFSEKKYDIVFGHWCFTESKYIPHIDITGVQSTWKLFGHIHNYQEIAENQEYVGAPVPNAVNEFPTNAVCWTFEKNGSEVVGAKEALPEFVKLKKVTIEKGQAENAESLLKKEVGNYYYLFASSVRDYSILKQLKLTVPMILGISLSTVDEDQNGKQLIINDAFFSKVGSLQQLYKQLYEEKVITADEMSTLNKYCN